MALELADRGDLGILINKRIVSYTSYVSLWEKKE